MLNSLFQALTGSKAECLDKANSDIDIVFFTTETAVLFVENEYVNQQEYQYIYFSALNCERYLIAEFIRSEFTYYGMIEKSILKNGNAQLLNEMQTVSYSLFTIWNSIK